MKKYFTLIILFLIPLLNLSVLAQTKTNVPVLLQLADEFDAEWQRSQTKVITFANENNLLVRKESSDGTVMEMIDVIDGQPVYFITDNLGAAQTTRADELWEGGSTGFNIDGSGYVQLGSWDAGHVRYQHQEFMDQGSTRAHAGDGSSSTHYHSTHVAGTLIAAGVVPTAKGMAYAGDLTYYEWSNDESEMAAAAADGLEISNHSYGQVRGWRYDNGWDWYGTPAVSDVEDYKFGFYDGNARQWDQIAFNAPNYLIVKSAGNDRGDGPGNAGQDGNPEKDGGDDGYDCIGTRGVCKNVMTVGAVQEVADYTGPESVIMSGFSSWGPADDGRIKPDIVGKGVGVYSTMNGSNTDYSSLNGTSMSAPNVAGSMALLQKYYQDTHDSIPMRSATLKALVLHTADEAGDHPGPDYIFGWGLMNAERAAQVINEDSLQPLIREELLEGGDLYLRDISVAEGAELRVTICWTDPPAVPVTASLNPRDPMLVNDLDLSINDEAINTYYPYKLDYDNPSAAATTDGKNYVDNVEMIYIPEATGGTYTIMVTHDGMLEGNEQAFSIIVTGIDEYTGPPACVTELLTPGDSAADIFVNEWISWEEADYASSYDVYFGTDGEGIETPTNVYDGENFPTNGFSYVMDPLTTYYLQVVPRNNNGAADSCGMIWQFATMDAIHQYPFLEDVMDADVPELPEFWQSYDTEDTRWESSNLIGYNDNQSLMCWNPEGVVETNYDNWLVSPPFEVMLGNEYYVNFQYKSFLGSNDETLKLYWGFTPNAEDLTNLAFEDVDFAETDWKEGEYLYIPEEDGLVFFGWHVESIDGYGVFVDEIKVEDWGTVNVTENPGEQVLIYSNASNLVIQSGEEWEGATLTVVNLLGQLQYAGVQPDHTDIAVSDLKKGIYIVNLQKGNKTKSQKVLIH